MSSAGAASITPHHTNTPVSTGGVTVTAMRIARLMLRSYSRLSR